MATNRFVASAAVAACVALAIARDLQWRRPLTLRRPRPQRHYRCLSAEGGATWLATQLTSGGYIASATTPGTADLSATANAVLALASAGVDQSGGLAALSYLENQVATFVPADGSDGPGQLALLILDAHALGVDPHNFGGTDLVARLLGTQQTSGTDAGLFGTEAQVNDFSAGVYNQGLALAALAAVGTTSGAPVVSAESWLDAQQCPDGGWTSYITTTNPCNGDPASFEGPDTNSTALAVEGLAAQGALTSTISSAALSFIAGAQDSDGGWGYEPNASSAPGSTDPDSTALVIQGILALGLSPSAAQFQQGTSNPVSALLSFQVTSGTGVGAFSFPGTAGPEHVGHLSGGAGRGRGCVPVRLHIDCGVGQPHLGHNRDTGHLQRNRELSRHRADGIGDLQHGHHRVMHDGDRPGIRVVHRRHRPGRHGGSHRRHLHRWTQFRPLVRHRIADGEPPAGNPVEQRWIFTVERERHRGDGRDVGAHR